MKIPWESYPDDVVSVSLYTLAGVLVRTFQRPEKECDGSGTVTLRNLDDHEDTICEPCNHGKGCANCQPCPTCNGTGEIDHPMTYICPDCGGSGQAKGGDAHDRRETNPVRQVAPPPVCTNLSCWWWDPVRPHRHWPETGGAQAGPGGSGEGMPDENSAASGPCDEPSLPLSPGPVITFDAWWSEQMAPGDTWTPREHHAAQVAWDAASRAGDAAGIRRTGPQPEAGSTPAPAASPDYEWRVLYIEPAPSGHIEIDTFSTEAVARKAVVAFRQDEGICDVRLQRRPVGEWEDVDE